MKKQNKLEMLVKKAGEKAISSASNKASLLYCYQPKQPKGLEKFSK